MTIAEALALLRARLKLFNLDSEGKSDDELIIHALKMLASNIELEFNELDKEEDE